MDLIMEVLEKNSLIFAFVIVGLIMLVSEGAGKTLTKGRVHGSAIAIVVGLVLAYWGGIYTDGSKGLGDIAVFSGLALLGGSMLRDFAIVATAYGVDIQEIRKAGVAGVVALFLGITLSFVFGGAVAYAFGYRDPESLVTIGAGAATYIVGPVTGTAVGASSEVIALSVAAGLIKAVIVMVGTPAIAKIIGLNNSKVAMSYGGLMGTTSGVAAGLAATDKRLVPYGAMTSTFYTGLACLLGPSIFYFAFRLLFG